MGSIGQELCRSFASVADFEEASQYSRDLWFPSTTVDAGYGQDTPMPSPEPPQEAQPTSGDASQPPLSRPASASRTSSPLTESERFVAAPPSPRARGASQAQVAAPSATATFAPSMPLPTPAPAVASLSIPTAPRAMCSSTSSTSASSRPTLAEHLTDPRAFDGANRSTTPAPFSFASNGSAYTSSSFAHCGPFTTSVIVAAIANRYRSAAAPTITYGRLDAPSPKKTRLTSPERALEDGGISEGEPAEKRKRKARRGHRSGRIAKENAHRRAERAAQITAVVEAAEATGDAALMDWVPALQAAADAEEEEFIEDVSIPSWAWHDDKSGPVAGPSH
ncbi:hypothetical protein DFH07DRAFT_952979 [Mycena maculata]|uniref:Uncharacterized protein n=1 Tax=Mycena maculata TaxID=230809 RepID=A0AAD7NS54_9AGAR|nr:hypothetical protein DFH07DRAFT_952979 [Mycena maculata]